MDISAILAGYDTKNLTVGALVGHSALDVAHGAKRLGFRGVVVAQKGRHSVYERYKTKDERGCIDELIVVDKFQNVLDEAVQKELRYLNTIFFHNRYFWFFFDDSA